eukprot:5416737-Ditylum_brightwellii.AAC.1
MEQLRKEKQECLNLLQHLLSAADIGSDEIVCAFISGSGIVFHDNKEAAHTDTDVQEENNANN